MVTITNPPSSITSPLSSSPTAFTATASPPEPNTITTPKPTTLLILGAGWTSLFLDPLLTRLSIPHASTTRDGRNNTIPFVFDPSSTPPSPEPYRLLPTAETVLVTFPLRGRGQSKLLCEMYASTHESLGGRDVQWIQLGSSGIWGGGSGTTAAVSSTMTTTTTTTTGGEKSPWVTRHSAYDMQNERAVAEDELLALGGCVLNLAGLWGGERRPRSWVDRVAGTKEALGGKGSLHLVHGVDVARAVVAVMKDFTAGERWMLTDLMAYDWWALVLGWAGGGEGDDGGEAGEKSLKQLQWVQELLVEKNVKALPRSPEQLGRCYDSREFWSTFKLMPIKSGVT